MSLAVSLRENKMKAKNVAEVGNVRQRSNSYFEMDAEAGRQSTVRPTSSDMHLYADVS